MVSLICSDHTLVETFIVSNTCSIGTNQTYLIILYNNKCCTISYFTSIAPELQLASQYHPVLLVYTTGSVLHQVREQPDTRFASLIPSMGSRSSTLNLLALTMAWSGSVRFSLARNSFKPMIRIMITKKPPL